MTENTIEIIDAIGKQWKFILTVFVIGTFLFKWKTIWSLIENFTQIRIKRGDNEIELHRNETNVEKGIEKKDITQEKNESDNESIVEKEKIPENSQDFDRVFNLYFEALVDKKFEIAETNFQILLEDEKDLQKRNELKVRDFYWRFKYGHNNAFEELEKHLLEIENDNELKSFSMYYLGLIFNETNDYKKSIQLITDAFNLSNIDKRKTNCIKSLSSIHFENDNKQDALNVIISNLNKINDRKPKALLYTSLAELYKKTDQKLLEAIAYQKAVELSPNNTSFLFDSAYNYSETGLSLEDIGLFLYKKLLHINPNDSTALNNLGVAYKRLQLDVKSISSYKNGAEKGSSLAASNVAYVLIENGFNEEALEYLDKAEESTEKVHDNIFSANTRLKEKIKEEKESEEKLLIKAQKKYKFLSKFGDAAFLGKKIIIENRNGWKINENELSLNLNGNNLELKWVIGEETHEIVGTMVNYAFQATYNKPGQNKFLTEDNNGFGYFLSPKEAMILFEIKKEIIEFKVSLK